MARQLDIPVIVPISVECSLNNLGQGGINLKRWGSGGGDDGSGGGWPSGGDGSGSGGGSPPPSSGGGSPPPSSGSGSGDCPSSRELKELFKRQVNIPVVIPISVDCSLNNLLGGGINLRSWSNGDGVNIPVIVPTEIDNSGNNAIEGGINLKRHGGDDGINVPVVIPTEIDNSGNNFDQGGINLRRQDGSGGDSFNAPFVNIPINFPDTFGQGIDLKRHGGDSTDIPIVIPTVITDSGNDADQGGINL